MTEEPHEKAMDAYTNVIQQALMQVILDLTETPPAGFSFADTASCVCEAAMTTTIVAAETALHSDAPADMPIEERSAGVIAFLVDGLGDSVVGILTYVGSSDEDEPCEVCGGPGGDGPPKGGETCPRCDADWSAAL